LVTLQSKLKKYALGKVWHASLIEINTDHVTAGTQRKSIIILFL
jgi:hypothetical protein